MKTHSTVLLQTAVLLTWAGMGFARVAYAQQAELGDVRLLGAPAAPGQSAAFEIVNESDHEISSLVVSCHLLNDVGKAIAVKALRLRHLAPGSVTSEIAFPAHVRGVDGQRRKPGGPTPVPAYSASRSAPPPSSGPRSTVSGFSTACAASSMWRAKWQMFFRRAQDHQASAAVVAYRIRGTGAFWRGEMAAARTDLEQALALYDPEQHHSLASLYVHDARVAAVSAPLMDVVGTR